MKRVLVLLLSLALTACGGGTSSQPGPTAITAVPTAAAAPVRVGLDWTPNTNHTGLYVARDQGYYRDSGLTVEIIQAPEGGTVEQLVAAGQLDFGVSYQEGVTQARVEGLPIISVAAIIQHNTSGFASRQELGIVSPADFAGKKYGAFGSAVERAVIQGLMQCVGADASTVQFVDIGSSDFFVATERGDVDFVWIFKGWTGMEAEQRGVPLNIVMLNDQQCIPDYYTPVLITSEKLIAENPDLVRRFMRATSAGYQFAIKNPDAAAEVLLAAVPELDPGLVRRSQQYLSMQYQAEAPRWGEQQRAVWHDYAAWMAERNLIAKMIDPDRAFTNAFLP